jgi:uncharacterized protein YegP (UPF0339 family)
MPTKFEIAPSANGQFIWRFRAGNGEIVGHGETYTTKQACQNAIDLIKREAATTPIEDLTLPPYPVFKFKF